MYFHIMLLQLWYIEMWACIANRIFNIETSNLQTTAS